MGGVVDKSWCRKEYIKLSKTLTTKPQYFIPDFWKAFRRGYPVDFVPTDNNTGDTLFLRSLRWRNCIKEGIPDFLLDAGADVNITNNDGDNALHISIKSTAPKKIIERILKRIINIDLSDNAGDTVLYLAGRWYIESNKQENEPLKVINLLLDHGADTGVFTDKFWNDKEESTSYAKHKEQLYDFISSHDEKKNPDNSFNKFSFAYEL